MLSVELLHSFRKIQIDSSTASVSGQGPSGIIAVHRDGTKFDVEIQMRVVESPDELLHVLWITYDRNANFVKDQSSDVNGTLINYERRREEYVSEDFKSSKEDKKEQDEEEENFPLSKFIAAGGKPPPLKHISSDNRKITTPPAMSPAPRNSGYFGTRSLWSSKVSIYKNDPEKVFIIMMY